MDALNEYKINRFKELNEIAVKSLFSEFDPKRHSDVGIWGLNISKVTESIVIREFEYIEKLTTEIK